MRDEHESQAQRMSELQRRVVELERDKAELQELLLENDESVTEHFEIYFHSHDMVVSVDMETEKVLRCNRAMINKLGYGRAEIVGHPIFKFYHQDRIEDAKEQFRVLTETGEIHDAEQTLRKRDGGKMHVSLNATTVPDENGNPTMARFDWRDTTRHSGEFGELRSENLRLKERLRSNRPQNPEVFSDIITQNPAMYSIFRQVESIAGSGNPVLITGETGVGKEKIAAVLHQLSGRHGEFVTVNIAGLDDMLFSDTLFGHEKGAYTGADSARRGLIERASGGTLFLDEIGELRTESQTKLLRFLQEGEYRHLGEDTPIIGDVRIVAATNQTIESLTGSENFRSDLYYRLAIHHIHLPPLRERVGDIPLLLSHFLKRAAAELSKKAPTPPPELVTLLSTYHFPGNIRELEGMVNDAVSRHEGGVLSTEAFRRKIDEHTSVFARDGALKVGAVTFSDTLSLLQELPALKEIQDHVIAEALERADGNQTIAARILGMSRQALHKRLHRARKTTDDT
ncbi:MAG: sigma 54-interacting transcriptional regulator [Candidatus Poribacteria bacterium]|nr:sigma 54-interacting transcriptional regulator [Candidatus Poribacteria bacterium]MDE0502518.1 sigma 54-interacting transcriptional regulator [Candidatus Poribacteria bacterium]